MTVNLQFEKSFVPKIGDLLKETIVYENGQPIFDERYTSIYTFIIIGIYEDNRVCLLRNDGHLKRTSTRAFFKVC